MFPANIKILVADDMMTMRKIVIKNLKELGFTDFQEAADGIKAWEIITSDNSPGLIVSDWNMPNCSGLDLLKRVRSDSRYKHLPFMLVTAENDQAQVVEAVTAGVDNYVVKPFTADILRVKLEQVYKKKVAA
jgi:two-component system chemotaxis response regulator CheY